MRFVRNGQPVAVRLTQPLSNLTADGVICLIPITAEVVLSSEFAVNWPPTLECDKGPPATLRFEFLWWRTGDTFTTLSAEFVWTGGDMIVDLEVPSEPTATAVPTGAPTPTATHAVGRTLTPIAPQRLPTTGTQATGDSGLGWALIGVVILSLTISTALVLSRYPRR